VLQQKRNYIKSNYNLIFRARKNIFSTGGLPFFKQGINLHNHLKTKIMKLVKLSVFALTLGLFVASCGSGSGEAANTDTMAAPAPEAAPEAAPATPPPADTAAAPAADTTAAH